MNAPTYSIYDDYYEVDDPKSSEFNVLIFE